MHDVRVIPAVTKSLRRVQPKIRERIAQAIDALAANPRPDGCQKLGGYADHYRIWVGRSWRVMYIVNDSDLTVIVVKAGARENFYD